MTPGQKKKSSCWTCRLRHKKCDELQPLCGGCNALEIHCLYGSDKPDWMDSGKRQQQMTDKIKSQVKKNAKRRRGIALMESIARDISNVSEDVEMLSPSDDSSSLHVPISRSKGNAAKSSPTSDSVSLSHLADTAALDPPATSSTRDQDPEPKAALSELDMGFITGYMDYTFPTLFPFYRPPILKGGRTWLLALALKNSGFLNTIVSLSSYFFTIIPVALIPGHETCMSSTWKELHKQMDLALSTVQKNLKDISRRETGNSPLQSLYLLATITHLLIFEITLPSGKWQIHLDAATTLFKQIVRDHGDDNKNEGITKVWEKLSTNLSSPMSIPPSPNQSAFRFFSTLLLIEDVIASVSLERSPRLTDYHHELRHDGSGNVPTLSIEEIMGCEAWVLLAISDISILDSWKNECKKSGNLIEADLISRAESIETSIKQGLARLDGKAHSEKSESIQGNKPAQTLEALLQQSNCSYGYTLLVPELNRHITRIWAHAAYLYVLVVLLGWQPTEPRIRRNCTMMIELFNNISSPIWLRSLAWPFCVSGCLALGEDREEFRRIGSAMEGLLGFGTAREALSIMAKVWSQGDMDAESWDIGACLKILGHRVLLV
ncbi:fungal-specific transcription factor domain-containing protein [Dactylonectria estremocensis]|uniref:Fungal-specific transcription factor domain-containing protein n=1 Tax=Dactylonectria estremocensis TaxID=1079267 RepID=A0A9P9DVI4_9HYPO|nr:fungal-specific transcription factor domain-containing protein [Dactylonectria estremocensis]